MCVCLRERGGGGGGGGGTEVNGSNTRMPNINTP